MMGTYFVYCMGSAFRSILLSLEVEHFQNKYG